MNDETTALYRFFSKSDELLYIGISNCIPRRFDQHGDTKPWYTQVARMTVEHHPNRTKALIAEKAAIHAEKPKYNIQHNRRSSKRSTTAAPGRWLFASAISGVQFQTDLHLYGELDCSGVVGDYDHLDGEGQLAVYLEYLEENYPQWLEDDEVPILWSVRGRSVSAFAPFQVGKFALEAVGGPMDDFLSDFTWPVDRSTREDLDFFKLPVRIDRFPEFAEALDWMPSPLQPTCPLRSILDSRECRVRRPLGWRPPW